jgi:hypothetical protein
VAAAIGAAGVSRAPDLVSAPDQGLRLVDSCGSWPATLQQAPSRALENPAIASYRLRALKVSPGQRHHGIVTKASNPMTGGRGG